MTILIVDDATTTRRALRRAVARLMPEAELHEAKSLEVAKAWLLAKPFDLVLLDWTIGCRSGAELLEAMASGGVQRSPTIVVSAVTDPAALDTARDDGARGWVVKPYELEELHEAIHSACAA